MGLTVYQIARIGERIPAVLCARIGALALGAVLVVHYRQPLIPALSVLTIIGLSATLGDAAHSRRTSRAERARRAAEAREQEVQRRVVAERLDIASTTRSTTAGSAGCARSS